MASNAMLATAGGEDVYLWQLVKPADTVSAPNVCLPPQAGGVTALSWTSVSNSLATASARGTISLFSQGGAHLESMSSRDSSGIEERVKCLSFASQSLSLCSGGSSTELRVWDCKRKEVLKTYHGHKATISACAYGDKDTLLASGSSSGDILVHSVGGSSDEPQRVKTCSSGSSDAIRTLKFSPFRRSHLAAAGERSVVELYDTARTDSPSLVQFTQHTGTITGVVFSPVNELLLCSAGLDGRVLFYDVQAKKLVKSVTCESPICSLDFMNDGFTVAAGTQSGKVLIYDLRALGSGGVPARSFEAHPGTHVSSVTFQLLPAKPAKSKPKVVGKENSKPSKASVSAANDPHPPSTAATGGARERECSPQQGSLSSTTAAKHELLPESTMTAEELRRVHSKKSEEEKMKQRLLSSTHDSPARQSCGAGSLAVDALPASAGGGVAQTPPRASRESLLQDLEKIRQERALEEERLRSTRSSLGGGLSTPVRTGDAALHPVRSSVETRRDQKADGPEGSEAGSIHQSAQHSMLGPSFSPLQTYPTQARGLPASPASALDTRTQQQQPRSLGGFDAEDLPPPPASSARKLPPTPTKHGQQQQQQRPMATDRKLLDVEEAWLGRGAAKDSGGEAWCGEELHGQHGASLNMSGATGHLPREMASVIQAAVEQSIASVQDRMREDVQNLHLDMIRQFHLQQAETRSLLEAQQRENRELKEEVVLLREELCLLKYLH